MAKPMNLTLRQMLEGMTLTFDAAAAGDRTPRFSST
jgi:hypothetical protein